jgi:ATP-dependent Clp protease protease subunit
MRNKSHLLELINTIHDRGIQPETNEIHLHSFIANEEEECGVDYRSAVTFIKNLRILEALNSDPILVHMNLPGGFVQHGFAIYDAISQSKNRVVLLGYSEICSMSTVVFQAADLRILTPSCSFMVHKIALNSDMTPIHGVKSSLQDLQVNYTRMLNVYAAKCINGEFFKSRNYSLGKIKSYIDKKIMNRLDWYMDAEEAVYYGFADGILGTKDYPNLKAIHV